MNRLAIDFGTSNTAAAVLVNGRPYVIPLEGGERTLPTALFFDYARRDTLIGHAAVAALIAGREGRFMRALKSVLGTPIMREQRQLMTERLTLIDVVARFLAQVKARAEAHCEITFDAVLSGRPVAFHSRGSDRDARALADLTTCYRIAGFSDVAFMYEPEAAARASGAGAGLGLIVDIGGGTSDFTVFGADRILANNGVRIGGTDFDRALNLAHVMPLLGLNTDLRDAIGPGTSTAPVAVFNDLATWEKIAFMYSPETRRLVSGMARVAVAQDRFARLERVVADELGHDIAFAVERGKIAANEAGTGVIDLRLVERGLRVGIDGCGLDAALGTYGDRIVAEALATVAMAEVTPAAIERLVFVGGSSLLAMIDRRMRVAFPQAWGERADAFTGVVDGLALAAVD